MGRENMGIRRPHWHVPVVRLGLLFVGSCHVRMEGGDLRLGNAGSCHLCGLRVRSWLRECFQEGREDEGLTNSIAL